jgi:alkaline phosphatase
MRSWQVPLLSACLALATFLPASSHAEDHLRQLQSNAIAKHQSAAAHWGYEVKEYDQWGKHSNRLIPVYTYGTKGAGKGVDLTNYTGENSVYRNKKQLTKLYGELPAKTLNKRAEYLDQTNIYDLQLAAAAAGKRHIFLVVLDGMDWQTTRAAAIYNSQAVTYESGRGTGTFFQEYQAGGTSQYGYMVTSPHNEGTDNDPDKQQVINPGGTLRGGYDWKRGGSTPWDTPTDERYLVSLPSDAKHRHAYTDSAPSAVSMMAGIKSYNNAIGVDPFGRPVITIAHELQEQGWLVGVVSSVPISHATPAAAYSHNVSRHDYQDISRDLLGLPSVSHPQALPGMDIVIGTGWGITAQQDPGQGKNFVPGGQFLADDDLHQVDARHGGRYVVAQRSLSLDGGEGLQLAAKQAVQEKKRLLGFYGTAAENLPYQTADGGYDPALDRDGKAIKYTEADLQENPTLAEMTAAALTVAQESEQGFWLLVEAGDVDWANHADNLDSSIGAVNSGDAAFRTIINWVEQHSNWNDSLVIVTADHGHMLTLDRPELLIGPVKAAE